MLSGAETRSHSQWNLGDPFPNFVKKNNIKIIIFLKIGIFIQSPHTQAIYFNILFLIHFFMTKVFAIVNMFFLTKTDILRTNNKFPNLGVTALIFPV